MTRYIMPDYALLNADKLQIEAICNLLIHDYYLFIDSDLKIINHSKNCASFSKKVLRQDLRKGMLLGELFESIDEDCSKIKLLDFKRCNFLHDKVFFKFKIGSNAVAMQLTKICFGSDYAWAALIEEKFSEYETSDLFDNKHLLANLSWFTSHKLRGPLSAMMSLIQHDAQRNTANDDYSQLLLSEMRQQAENLDEAIHTLSSLLSNSKSATTINPTGQHKGIKNILMLDDEVITHMVAKRIISDINPDIAICSFTEGKEALEFLETFPVDLILLDLNMHPMNGWEFLQAMERLQMQIPTIIISSSIDTNDINHSFEYASVKGFINKPVGKEDLRRILINPVQLDNL